MDIGLYKLKYPIRRLIEGALPFFLGVDPTYISYFVLPIGLAMGACCYFAPNGYPSLYLVAVALTLCRIYFAILDGLVADHYKRRSALGRVIDILMPKLCDMIFLVCLSLAKHSWHALGICAIAMAWFSTFAGLIGLLIKKPMQRVGPVGQMDRLAAFCLCAMLAYFTGNSSYIRYFFIWCIAGGVLTCIFRLRRTLAIRENGE
jgi:phosphatidylglycerophosphate synthase